MDTQGTHWQPPHNLAAGLVYSARASDVHTVMVDGRVILHERRASRQAELKRRSWTPPMFPSESRVRSAFTL